MVSKPKAEALPEKRCAKCKEVKPLSEFGQDVTARDGRRSSCGPCQRASARKRRGWTPERAADRDSKVSERAALRTAEATLIRQHRPKYNVSIPQRRETRK